MLSDWRTLHSAIPGVQSDTLDGTSDDAEGGSMTEQEEAFANLLKNNIFALLFALFAISGADPKEVFNATDD